MMLFSLAVLTAGALVQIAHGQGVCANGQVYAAGYNCFGGKYLCGPGSTEACPHANGDGGYDCYNPQSPPNYGCGAATPSSPGGTFYAGNPDDSRAVKTTSSGSTAGDPLVQGFDGCAWYMKGEPGKTFNMISEAEHTVNAYLVPANLTDESHNNDGTFHGSLSVRFRESLVVANVTAEGNLTVSMDGQAVAFEETRSTPSGLELRVIQYMPYFGQVAEVETPAFKFLIHAVQPYENAAGFNRGHLDFTSTVTAAKLTLHGLLGQTAHRLGEACPKDWDFHGEGSEGEYEVHSLDSTDYKYSLFSQASGAISRRLWEVTAPEPLAEPLVASAHGLH